MLDVVCRTVGAWVTDEAGASLVEYILMVALVAVVCVAAITFLGKTAKGKFEVAANTIRS